MKAFHGLQQTTYQTWRLESIQDCQGATRMLIRGVEIAGMAFLRDSGSSRCNGQVEPWRWSPIMLFLTRFKIFNRLSPNGEQWK
eukprot:1042883-Pyramimonas_sp.AAC.1